MIVFRHYRSVIRKSGLVLLLLASGSMTFAQQDLDQNDTDTQPTDQPDAATEQQPAESFADKPAITIEQITVFGERTFFRLRAQIEDAKKALYSNYNDLNLDDEFDVNCRQSDWTGTRIRELVCWPVFFENAVAENSQDFLRGNAVLEPVAQLQTQYQGKFDELRTNIIKVASENPEIEEALVELGTLEAAYAEKQAECQEKAPVLFIFKVCR